MPRMTLGGLEDFLRHVEVRVHLLDVIQILERLDEPDDLLRLLALEAHRVRRPHRDLRVGDLQLLGLERLLHGLEAVRRGVDRHEVAVRFDVVGAGVDGGELDLVGRAALRIDLDDALLLEQPLHGAGLAELPVVACERRAHFGGGAVPAVGRGLDHDRHAARAVALVHDAFDLRPLGAADGLVDRPLDVRERYVDRPGAVHREAEPEVAVGIAAALASGEHDLAGHLGEDRAAFDVVRALLALDRGPLGMAGHRSEYYGQSHSSGESQRWLQSHQTGSGTSRSPDTAVPARPRSLRPCSISWARPLASARWTTARASSTPIPRSTSAASPSTWPSPRSPTRAQRSISSTRPASPTSPATSTRPCAWSTRRSSSSTRRPGSRSVRSPFGTCSTRPRPRGSWSSPGSTARTPTSTTS